MTTFESIVQSLLRTEKISQDQAMDLLDAHALEVRQAVAGVLSERTGDGVVRGASLGPAIFQEVNLGHEPER